MSFIPIYEATSRDFQAGGGRWGWFCSDVFHQESGPVLTKEKSQKNIFYQNSFGLVSSFLFIIIIFFSLNVTPFVFSLCFLILGSCQKKVLYNNQPAVSLMFVIGFFFHFPANTNLCHTLNIMSCIFQYLVSSFVIPIFI